MTRQNTEYARLDKTIVLPNGKVAHRYQIITTDIVVHTAYEPSVIGSDAFYEHSTITHFDEVPGTLGRIGARRLPKELEAIPAGEERSAKVRKFHEKNYAESVATIIEAFPYLAKCADQAGRGMGEIETRVSDIPAEARQ